MKFICNTHLWQAVRKTPRRLFSADKFQAGLVNIETHLGIQKEDVHRMLEQSCPGGFDRSERTARILSWADIPKSSLTGAFREAYGSLEKRTAFERVLQFDATLRFSLSDLLAIYGTLPREYVKDSTMFGTMMRAVTEFVCEPLMKTAPKLSPSSGFRCPFTSADGHQIQFQTFLRACMFYDYRYRHQILPVIKEAYPHCDKTFLAFALRSVFGKALEHGYKTHTEPFNEDDDTASRILEMQILSDVVPDVKRGLQRLVVLRDMPLRDLEAIASSHQGVHLHAIPADTGEVARRRAIEYMLLGKANVDDDIKLANHHFNKPPFEEAIPSLPDLQVHVYWTSLFNNIKKLRSTCELKALLARPRDCPLREYLLHHHNYFNNEDRLAQLQELRSTSDRKPLSGLDRVKSAIPPERFINLIRLGRGLLQLLQGYGGPYIVSSQPQNIISLARKELSKRMQESAKLRHAGYKSDGGNQSDDVHTLFGDMRSVHELDYTPPCDSVRGIRYNGHVEHAVLVPMVLEMEEEQHREEAFYENSAVNN